jgi:hypothetical protein
MTVEVFGTDEFQAWFLDLSAAEQEAVINVVTKLEIAGVGLGRPHTGHLEGAKAPLRELRPKQGRSPLRILYAFDPKRNAVLLIGGDKSGDPKLYDRLIPVAERIWRQYLAEQRAGLHEDEE